MLSNLSFKNFSRRDEVVNQDKMVLRMSRILAAEKSPPLRELLEMCECYFGECTLSIVFGEDRSLVASTASPEFIEDVKNVAYRVKDIARKEHYLRSEVNGLYFRKGINCIRIYPLNEVVNRPCFLMVEQNGIGAASIDRVIDFMSIAVRLSLLIGDKLDSGKDAGTGLLNRDRFIECLNGINGKKEGYLGVFFLSNMQQLNKKLGMPSVDKVIKGAAALILRYFKESSRLSSAKIGVVASGEMYHVVAMLQDCLDELIKTYPMAEFKCVSMPISEDIYRIMYLCEKVCETSTSDAVVLIRDVNDDFDKNTTEEPFYQSYREEEEDVVDDVLYREIPLEEEELKKARSSGEKESTRSDYVVDLEKEAGYFEFDNNYGAFFEEDK